LQREYRILKSSLLCGYGIRNYELGMNLAPVDYAARSIVYLASRNKDGKGIFHIASQDTAVEQIFERCNEIRVTSLQLLPYYEWIEEVRYRHQRGQTLPAVPLVEFAFSMSEAEFHEYQRKERSTAITVSCTHTRLELERAGIVAPELSESYLRLFVENLYEMDPQLRRSLDFPLHSRTSRSASFNH
jgi:myxalamid-type nonribosomal peptide synthetase MxaA